MQWFKLLLLVLVVSLLGLVGCSGKSSQNSGITGTFSADFNVASVKDGERSSFSNPTTDIKITFNKSKAFIRYAALGQENTADLIVSYAGNKATVYQKGKKDESVVFLIKNGKTLECVKCPRAVPTVWNKVN